MWHYVSHTCDWLASVMQCGSTASSSHKLYGTSHYELWEQKRAVLSVVLYCVVWMLMTATNLNSWLHDNVTTLNIKLNNSLYLIPTNCTFNNCSNITVFQCLFSHMSHLNVWEIKHRNTVISLQLLNVQLNGIKYIQYDYCTEYTVI